MNNTIDRSTMALVTSQGFTNPQMEGESAMNRIDAEMPDFGADEAPDATVANLPRLPDGFNWQAIGSTHVVVASEIMVSNIAAQAPLLAPHLADSLFKTKDCTERQTAQTIATAIKDARHAISVLDERKVKDFEWGLNRFFGGVAWDAAQAVKLVSDVQSSLAYLVKAGKDPAEDPRHQEREARMTKAFSTVFTMELAAHLAGLNPTYDYAGNAKKVMDYSAKKLTEYHSTKSQEAKIKDSASASEALFAGLSKVLQAAA